MSEHPRNRTTSTYTPDSDFAYVGNYTVLNDGAFAQADNRSRQHGLVRPDEFSPHDALIMWSESSPGQWQSRQTARYPTFHRDLDINLLPFECDNDEKRRAFCKEQLHLLTQEPSRYNDDPANRDFHPLGHMARVLMTLDALLIDGPLSAVELDPFLLSVIRHAAALHDIGEIEHPGAVIKHGSVIGDIAASVGKTDADRAKERAIYSRVLGDIFADKYTDEVREVMTKIVSHETTNESQSFIDAHGCLEIAHDLNSVRTGEFIGDRAGDLALTNRTLHANFMSVIAEQSGKVLVPKFEKIFDHSPNLRRRLGMTASKALQNLNETAHCRDEDSEWLKWRLSEPIVGAFGNYTPHTF